MQQSSINIPTRQGRVEAGLTTVHTLILGSGAAGLNAAVQLKNQGVDDLLVISEGLDMGTSINTGSDKQTYYKLGMYGEEPDSPMAMAKDLFSGGSMHGDLALAEAASSARSFFNLVNLGVPFPRDSHGMFVGYKTDHDPRQRATSLGPYTSREMCRALIKELKRQATPLRERRMALELITIEQDGAKRIAGLLALNVRDNTFEAYVCENLVFAVGGPGGIYKTSVYPKVHTGAIGLALMAGAKARNLPESQYGLASVKFRWNVSGSFMQVVPRFISTGQDGEDPKEFMLPYFNTPDEMHSAVFLKGYQWPFDCRKVAGGSSLVDILVYQENVINGRRVWLDYRKDSRGFSLAGLSHEARFYLERSKATQDSPLERLLAMNPDAYGLYKSNDIDLRTEPLEIAVCAQHNNGGLAVNHWWESENLDGLFCVGEVSGTHGVTRPGGSALNSGQVGSLRAAEYIAARRRVWRLDASLARAEAEKTLAKRISWSLQETGAAWQEHLDELQNRMSQCGAHIRTSQGLKQAIRQAREQWAGLNDLGCTWSGPDEMAAALNLRQLCFAHLVYLSACKFAVDSGLGSRGSALVLEPGGMGISERLGDEWRFAVEDEAYRQKVLDSLPSPDGQVEHAWHDRRPLPKANAWFETTWADFKKGAIYEE
jgi:succinate dehydrogenase/fumarate reductase flavoprotein subunit